MTTPQSAVVDGPLPRSDEDLVAAARAGDDAAYAVLWERHVASARSAARAVSPNVDPDDIVSEAFTSILSAIRKGGGPQEGFRPYLFAAVRNVAASWGRRTPAPRPLAVRTCSGLVSASQTSSPARRQARAIEVPSSPAPTTSTGPRSSTTRPRLVGRARGLSRRSRQAARRARRW